MQSTNPDDWDVVSQTVIDVNGADDRVINLGSDDDGVVIKGLTLTGANGWGIRTYFTDVTIENCIIKNNGTAMWLYWASQTIRNNKIIDNSGGGISLTNCSSDIINNLIYGNKWGITASGTNLDATIVNNTIAYNTDNGIKKSYGTVPDPNISNCILWANSDDLDSSFTAIYSCIEDGDSGTGNIISDPCFLDADNNDFHLDVNSLCIDAGDPNGDYDGEFDIDGQPRVMVAEVDIGADEAAYFPFDHNDYNEWVDVNEPDCWCYGRQCRGDADNFAEGGKLMYWVSVNDLNVLLAAWQKKYSLMAGQTYEGTPWICADFDHYPAGGPKLMYRVSVGDLNILLASWQIEDGPDPNCFD